MRRVKWLWSVEDVKLGELVNEVLIITLSLIIFVATGAKYYSSVGRKDVQFADRLLTVGIGWGI